MKILHLIEKGVGLQQAPEGHLESLLWSLNAEERAADFVAFHKQKSQRSWKGGRIVGVREATSAELDSLVDMPSVRKGRLVVQFEPVRRYNGRPGVPWGGNRRGSMAYKSLEEVGDKSARETLN